MSYSEALCDSGRKIREIRSKSCGLSLLHSGAAYDGIYTVKGVMIMPDALSNLILILPIERRGTCDHHVKQNSQRPDVAAFIVAAC